MHAAISEAPGIRLHPWADAPAITVAPRGLTPGSGPDGEADADRARLHEWLLQNLAADEPTPETPNQQSSPATVRQRAIARLEERAGAGVEARFRAVNGTPRLIRGPGLEPRFNGVVKADSDRDTATARSFLINNRSLLRTEDPDREWRLVDRQLDTLGRRHLRFAQVYRQIEVWPCELTVHLDPAGNVDGMEGAYVPTPAGINPTPALDRDEALQRARALLGDDGTDARVTENKLVLFAPLDRPVRLSWRCEISVDPGHLWRFVIDARTGEVLQTINRVRDLAAAGSGVDGSGTRRDLNLWRQGQLFYMIDTSKPMFDPASAPPNGARGAIQIFDARGSEINDPSFSVGHVTSSSATDGWPVDAVDAAFGLSETHDYFHDRHERNSLDGQGGSIRAIIHFGNNVQNAFWNPGTKTMLFGAGFTRGLDVSGHELTHGVIDSIGNGGVLEYFGEPGALNEAFSDILGEMVEAFSRGGSPDWLKAADLGFVIQNYADPGAVEFAPGRVNPARMSEFVHPIDPVLDLFPRRDANGVHINSSIVNHCFYLLAEGMDNAVGLRASERIFYRALTIHLQKQSRFIDLRFACLNAAEALFGSGSAEVRAVAGAFDRVEIFDAPGTPAPGPVPTIDALDSTVALRWDPVARHYFLVRREAAFGDGTLGLGLHTVKFLARKRMAVTGNGEIVFFVTADRDLGRVQSDGSNPRVAGSPGLVHSVAVAPNGHRYAFVLSDSSGEPGNSITVGDLRDGTQRVIELYAPGTENARLDIIRYADTMNFSSDGGILIYDAYAEIRAEGGQVLGGWTLYALDLNSGTIRALVDLNDGFDFGNPSLGNVRNHLVTFEVIDRATGVSTVFAGDLFTGSATALATVNPAGGIGVPAYTGDDRAIVYAQGDAFAASGFSLLHQALARDGITPETRPTAWLFNANIGVIYRRGDFVGTNASPKTSIQTPAPEQTFQSPATIEIQATASDDDGTVARVEFYAGSNKLGEDSSAPYSFTWSEVEAGRHHLIARAIDELGAVGDSDPVAVTVTVKVSEAPNHPADHDPADFRMAIGEMSGYAAAWKKGEPWPLEPNPIPQGYMVRAATLWKRGETYTHDLNAGAAPVWWVNTPGQGFGSGQGPGDMTLTAPVSDVTVLYETDFDDFAAGFADRLRGQHGWEATSSGGTGVVSGYFTTLGRTGLGKQAFVGFIPVGFGESGVVAWHPFDHDRSEGKDVLRFSVTMALVRSTNNQHDAFGWGFLDSGGEILFTLNFRMSDNAITYSLNDGTTIGAPTGVSLTPDQIEDLEVVLDFAANRWTATYGTRTLVSDKPISTRGDVTTLSRIAALWALGTVNQPGNNFLLFDNYRVTTQGPPAEAPLISAHPEDRAVVVGASAVFVVAAEGTPPLTFQWHKDGSLLAGETGSTLTLTDVQTSDAGNYTVVVRNSAGSVTSNPANLAVTPPDDPKHPADRNPADFRIALGEMSAYASAWKRGDVWPIDPNPIPQGYMVRAATLWKRGESYTHDPTAGGAPVWWVTADAQGLLAGERQTSADTGGGGGTNPPVITVHPASRTVTSGSTVTFHVTATGTMPLTFQWRFERMPIADATSPTLELQNVGLDDSGNYSVVVSNGLGAVISQPAELVVEETVVRFTMARLVTGTGFRFTLTGPAGRQYVIETSADLEKWVEIVTLTNTTGTLQFTDTEAPGLPSGFYRARMLP